MALTFTNDSATISTSEYSLPADTTSGVPTSQTTDGEYWFFIDFGAMIAGDQYEIKLYEKCDAAGTQRLIEIWILTGAQGKPMFVVPSMILGEGWDLTVKRLAGSDRSIAWSIRRDDFASGGGLDAAGVRAAVGLASANLDTQLSTIAGYIDTEIATLITNVATILTAVDTEVAAIKAKTDQLVFTIANKVDSSVQAAGDFAQAAADKVWSTAARVLTAGTNIVLAKGTGVTGFNDLSAAQVNTEVDTALTDYDAPTSAELVTEINSVQTDIAALNNLSAAQINAEVVDVLRTDTIPDSYAADGAQPTIAQAMLAIHQFLTEKSVSGTTVSVMKPDGASVVMTFTLNNGTTPTSISRAT